MRRRWWESYAPCGFAPTHHATHLWAGLFALTLLLAWPSGILADGIAQSGAALNWSGLTFTSDGSLTFTVVQAGFTAGSGASTSLGGFAGEDKYSFQTPQWGVTSASSQYLTATGSSVTQSQTNFGLLRASSQTAAVSRESSFNTGESRANSSSDFWLYGTGVGSITVTAPYTLSALCSITGPQDASRYNTAEADASVVLLLGDPVGGSTSDSISCNGNSEATKNGVLSLSLGFNNPYWGPLVDITAFAETSATASSVPEPSSLLLLAIGVIGFGSTVKRKCFS
jgi:hypothetical protein